MKYIKSASRLLYRDYINKRGLYLSTKVLWVSIGQRAAELPAINVEGLEKKSAAPCGAGDLGSSPPEQKNFSTNLQH